MNLIGDEILTMTEQGQLALNINQNQWEKLQTTYSKKELKQFISDTIKNYNVPPPYRYISKEEAESDFIQLQKLDTSNLIIEGKFYSRYSYSIDPDNVYINQNNVGNRCSDYFHQKNRWLCNSITSPSPYRCWYNEKFRLSMLDALFTLKLPKVSNQELRTVLSMRKYVASQFRPSVAKTIYDKFNAKIICDPSMGWGDRLAGFMASKSTKFYLGVDPNTNLSDGYNQQLKYFLPDDKVALHFPACSEDFYFGKSKYDLVFTSPPYLDIERYTSSTDTQSVAKDETQSWVRYVASKSNKEEKLQCWLENFLFVVVDKMIHSLQSKGILAINISDVYCHHKINHLCNPLIAFVAGTNKMEDPKYWGIRMPKRIKTKVAQQDGIFCEPLFIWRKK